MSASVPAMRLTLLMCAYVGLVDLRALGIGHYRVLRLAVAAAVVVLVADEADVLELEHGAEAAIGVGGVAQTAAHGRGVRLLARVALRDVLIAITHIQRHLAARARRARRVRRLRERRGQRHRKASPHRHAAPGPKSKLELHSVTPIDLSVLSKKNVQAPRCRRDDR